MLGFLSFLFRINLEFFFLFLFLRFCNVLESFTCLVENWEIF